MILLSNDYERYMDLNPKKEILKYTSIFDINKLLVL